MGPPGPRGIAGSGLEIRQLFVTADNRASGSEFFEVFCPAGFSPVFVAGNGQNSFSNLIEAVFIRRDGLEGFSVESYQVSPNGLFESSGILKRSGAAISFFLTCIGVSP